MIQIYWAIVNFRYSSLQNKNDKKLLTSEGAQFTHWGHNAAGEPQRSNPGHQGSREVGVRIFVVPLRASSPY